MTAFSMLGIVIAVLAVLGSNFNMSEDLQPDAAAVALNFIIFRQSAHDYVLKNNASGVIDSQVLTMPLGWLAQRLWNARVEGAGNCYVWGSASDAEIAEARALLRHSMTIGQAVNGFMEPRLGNPIPLPDFIPSGSLVSAVKIR